MNRTDRLFAIVLELQRKERTTAEELAATFDVTKRTIYRDIAAISETGVPVVAEPGVGYSIIEGYFLPPVNFTNDEATMLLLGADFVAQNFDRQYREAASSASGKIEAVLSRKKRKEVKRLIGSMRFLTMTPLENSALIDRLRRVRSAILESKTVRFKYYKRYPADESEKGLVRKVDPYVLFYLSGNWLLGGYDHLRKALRSFRLSRIEKLEISDQSFIRPKNFRLKDFEKGERSSLHAKVLFSPAVRRWVLESKPYFVHWHKVTAEGLIVHLRSNNPDQVLHWLLGWGGAVEVLSPESFQQMHAEQARQIISHYENMLT